MTAESPASPRDPDPTRLVLRHALHDAWARTFPRRARVLLLGGEAADEEWLRLCGCVPVAPASDRPRVEGACNGLDGPGPRSWAADLTAALPPGAPVVLALPRGTGRPPQGFAWRSARGLGLLLSAGPDWARRHPLAFGLLAALDHVCGRCPLLRGRAPWQLRTGVRQ